MTIEELYRRLQQRLDLFSMGFPATGSGIEIAILKHLFSEQDARLFLQLGPTPEKPSAVAARLGVAEETVRSRLEDMADRGLLFRLRKNDASRFAAIPFVHGIFEFQVNRLDRELVEMVEVYFKEGFEKTMQEGAGYFLRPIPVKKSIDVRHHVAAYEDAVAILKEKPKIVVAECICRKSRETIGKGCGKPLEACFMFGSMGQYYLDRGMGREVALDEAVAILERCQAAGLVTQPATAQNPSGMCNCCGDCCGVLRSLNHHPRPAEMVFSNHLAAVDAALCTGCGTCVDRCQMGAISPGGDGVARVSPDRCIGCGLCVTTCPTEAMVLVSKPEAERRVPPATMGDQMRMMAEKRGIL